MTIFQPGRKLSDYEKEIIQTAYRFYNFNKTKTAQALGIAIRTLDNKLSIYSAQEVKNDSERSSRTSV